MQRFFGVVVIGAFLPLIASAHKIIVTIEGSFSEGLTLVKIHSEDSKDKPAGFYGRATNGDSHIPGESGRTDANGDFSSSHTANQQFMKGADGIGVVVDGQVWESIYDSGTYWTPAQEKKQEEDNKTPKLKSFETLPFSGIDAFFHDTNQLIDQMTIENLSTNGFEILSLKLYVGVDHAFFAPGIFASPGAIASGNLIKDMIGIVGDTIELPPINGLLLPRVTVSTGPITTPGYVLLTGAAREILGSGVHGPEINFALASSPVPEPGTVGTASMALALIWIALHRGRRLRSPDGRVSLKRLHRYK